jgi:hypothetical protein
MRRGIIGHVIFSPEHERNHAMKRTTLLAPVVAVALALLLSACGASPTGPAATGNPTATPTASNDGYTFVVKGATIAMHAEVAPILAKLGDPKEYFEAPSCAFQGIEKTYAYAGFKLTTYELDGVDHVASVLILDDSVATPEGVFMGATLDEVTKAYGGQYAQNLGLYTYTSGKMTLAFLLENGKVTSIEYAAKAT